MKSSGSKRSSQSECSSADQESPVVDDFLMVEQTEVQRFAADARMKVERATEDEDFVLKQKKARLEDALGPLDMGNDNKEMYGSCADVEMQAYVVDPETRQAEWRRVQPPGRFNPRGVLASLEEDIFGRKGIWANKTEAELETEEKLVKAMAPLEQCRHHSLPATDIAKCMWYSCCKCHEVGGGGA